MGRGCFFFFFCQAYLPEHLGCKQQHLTPFFDLAPRAVQVRTLADEGGRVPAAPCRHEEHARETGALAVVEVLERKRGVFFFFCA